MDVAEHSFLPDEAGKNRLDTTPTKPEASGRGTGAGPSSPVEWPERQPSPTGTIARAAEVLFPIIHPHAARALETGEGVAEWDETHVRAAEALAAAGLLADTTCRSCSGTGGTDLSGARCAVCHGTGHRRAEA